MPTCKQEDFTSVGTLVAIVVEIVVLMFSVTATYLHCKSYLGPRHNVRGANPTSFHAAHVLFCIAFVIFNSADYANDFCDCDPIILIRVLESISFWFYMCIFVRFWRKNISSEPKKAARRRYAAYASFSLVYAVGLIAAVLFTPDDPSCTSAQSQRARLIGFVGGFVPNTLLLAADTTFLAFYSFGKGSAMLEQLRAASTPDLGNIRKVQQQIILFCVIPISIVLGLIFLSLGGVFILFGFVTLYGIPSSTTLFLMWKRETLTVLDREEEIGRVQAAQWHSSSASTRSSLRIISLENDFTRTDLELAPSSGEVVILSSIVADLRDRLLRSPVATSTIEVRDAQCEILQVTETRLQPSSPALIIEEDLKPLFHLGPLVRMYLEKIVLLKMERISIFVGEKLDAYRPDFEFGASLHLGKLDTLRRLEEMSRSVDQMEATIEKTMSTFRAISRGMEVAGQSVPQQSKKKKKKQPMKQATKIPIMSDPGASVAADTDMTVFKPSTQKKNQSLTFLPTNCHVHSTSLGLKTPSGNFEDAASRDVEVADRRFLNVNVSVTFGAPAAHSLGFKQGGLRSMRARVRADYDHVQSLDTSSLSKTLDGTEKLAELGLALAQLEFNCRCREAIVASQALSAAIMAAGEVLVRAIEDHQGTIIRQFANIGLLLHSVCLLSTSGNEEGMLDDFAGIFEDLGLIIRLVPPTKEDGDDADPLAADGPSSSPGNVSVTLVDFEPLVGGGGDGSSGGFGQVAAVLCVSPVSAFEWIVASLEQKIPRVPHASAVGECAASKGGKVGGLRQQEGNHPVSVDIPIVPILFNLGVNEMQSVSNFKGTTSMQTEINEKGVERLRIYYDAFTEFLASGQGNRKALGELPELLHQLAELVEAEKEHPTKLVDLLLTSCWIARLLNAARTTSCKSAKDRTSVFHTLEMVRLAVRTGLLDSTREQALLDELRGPNGVRLKNCEFNTGRPKYAFNELQRAALPSELRPPAATCAAWGPS